MHQDNIFDHTRLKKNLYLADKKYIVRLGYFEDRRKFTFCADDWPLMNSNKKGNFVLHHLVLINSSTKKVSIFLMISRYFYRQIRLVSCTIIQTKSFVLEN